MHIFIEILATSLHEVDLDLNVGPFENFSCENLVLRTRYSVLCILYSRYLISHCIPISISVESDNNMFKSAYCFSDNT